MKKWKRRVAEDDEEEEEEEEAVEERPFLRRSVLGAFDFDDEEPRMSEGKWKQLEKKIRAGKYKPKASDPWTLHVLFDHLTVLGEL